jgi:hypothetical protein
MLLVKRGVRYVRENKSLEERAVEVVAFTLLNSNVTVLEAEQY